MIKAGLQGGQMDYIIFLITIQAPFLYFIWKIFQTRQNRLLATLRALETRMGQARNLLEAQRLSLEKTGGDLEKDMEKIRAAYALTAFRMKRLEKYTGLEDDSSPALRSEDITSGL